jgi:hypothetical protein
VQGKKQAKSEKCLVRKRERERGSKGEGRGRKEKRAGEMGTCFLYMCPSPSLFSFILLPLCVFFFSFFMYIHTYIDDTRGAPKKSNYINCGHPLVI